MSNVTKMEFLEGVGLKYKNFRGEERKQGGRIMNQAGKRNFNIILNEEQYEDLKAKGWQVRENETSNGDTEYLIKVNVSYGGRPPMIKLVPTDNSKPISITEASVGSLDMLDIVNAEVVIRPYNWDDTGRYGAAAYLRSMKLDIYVDPLEAKMGFYDNDEPMPFE